MALIRICDICRKSVEDISYVNIEYNKKYNDSFIQIPTNTTLCQECFEKYVNNSFLDNAFDDLTNRVKVEEVVKNRDTLTKEEYEQIMSSVKEPRVNKKLKKLLKMKSVFK